MSQKTPGFAICDNKGFHITFRNGVTVSVQFGGGNYCMNYDRPIPSHTGEECINAEVAIFTKNGDWITKEFDSGLSDDIMSNVYPDEVLKILTWAEAHE